MPQGDVAIKRAVQPQNERGMRRVNSLLEAAGLTFREKGYEATTMTEIAIKASASIGSLYQFFPTKESVATALAQQIMIALLDRLHVVEQDLETGRPIDIATRIADAFLSVRDEFPAFQALTDYPPPGTDEKSKRVLEAVQHIVEKTRPTAELERPRATALAVVALCKTMSSMTSLKSSDEDRDGAAQILVALRKYLET